MELDILCRLKVLAEGFVEKLIGETVVGDSKGQPRLSRINQKVAIT
jgi:hypothetical protein